MAQNYEKWKENRLMGERDFPNDSDYFLKTKIRRRHISAVTFQDNLNGCPSFFRVWDVGTEQGRVKAWAVSDNNLYHIYIGADGGINADAACQYLFASCINLQEVNFNSCFHLPSANDRSGNSESINMSWMFFDCQKLRLLDLSELDTSNVTRAYSMFSLCKNLIDLNLSGWNTKNVTDICGIFFCCESLCLLNLSGWDTSNIADMSEAFYGCSILRSLDLSGWDTSNVTDMHSMFGSCSNLTSLNLSGWNTSKVTDMRAMFKNCSSLTTLDISHFDRSADPDTTDMFTGCTRLRNDPWEKTAAAPEPVPQTLDFSKVCKV